MNLKSGLHEREHLDLVFQYALQVLPLSEIPQVEAQISACAVCRHVMDTLRPVIDAFVSWPTDVLRPSTSLWGRLTQRIGLEISSEVPAIKPEWEEAAPGISVKILATDAEKDRVSMLVRLAPGTDYPAHCHAGLEELHLIHGELMIDDKKLYPGDYIRANAGSVDHRVWSETGCTCVLMTSTKDAIL
jgi:ChrR-like protein with cupin domain